MSVVTYHIYEACGREITILSNSKLYKDILHWFNENIGEIAFDSPSISYVKFTSNEDYNLFRLMFKDRCLLVLHSEV